MIRYDIERMITLRGNSKPLDFLRDNGFPYHVCLYMLKNPKSVRFEQIEKLCRALKCTPNDLMEWVPDTKHPIETDHPLNKLCRNGSNDASLRGVLQSVPVSKLDEAMELLKKLSEDGQIK